MLAAETAAPGRVGPYAVSGVLGEGGSAVVYAASRDGREVALKVPRESSLSAKEQQRFLAEAVMLSRVEHPSIARVLDSGQLDDGTPYLAMQRYPGETLAQRLGSRGALPLERALDLFDQVADATHCLHEAGLVHRDLKAENVVLVEDGQRAVLLDFGIAKDVEAPASTTTQAGVARGTPATMAPERFFGAPASVASDVYELAVLLYAMLVGRLPWDDVTNVEARLNPAPPGSHVPSALASVVLRALSTRPERRPMSARALSDAVREAAGGQGPKSGRVTAETPVGRPSEPFLDPKPTLSSAASDGAQVLESQHAARLSLPPRRRGPLFAALALTAGLGLGLFATRTVMRTPPPDILGHALTNLQLPAVRAAAEPPATTPRVPAPDEPAAAMAAKRPAAVAAAPVAAPSGSAPPPPPRGKPRGAPCTRSSECASMLCAAEQCQ